MKGESRVLVYAIGHYYAVFATYRREFLEELLIITVPVFNLKRVLEAKMKTIMEVSYVQPCIGSKYDSCILPGFKVFEGGDEHLVRLSRCKLVETILKMLDKRGLIKPSGVDVLSDYISIDKPLG
jgi:hypothetical protein